LKARHCLLYDVFGKLRMLVPKLAVEAETSLQLGGLLYSSLQQFDTMTLSYGARFGDGGRFATAPRLFLNITGVDTNTSLPENDPINWLEVFGASLVREPDGETFDLTDLPLEQRQGFGWAIGGVNGDGNTSPTPQNFISISELSASGVSIPEPSATLSLAGSSLLFLSAARKERFDSERSLPLDACLIGGIFAQCDLFGIRSTSLWTGAAIIVRCPRTRSCIVTRSRTSNEPMRSCLGG
jgi:hypothetical protein